MTNIDENIVIMRTFRP